MSAPTANGKPTPAEKLERELLARLGLDASASPEDIAAAHEAVSAYLAAAPKGLRGWARTQAAGADQAYALLTDPAALARAVALVGAGARPAVLPGGPATPPAHRDTPAPAAAAVVPTAAAAARPAGKPKSKPAVDENGRRIVSDDEIDALLAEVDDSARPEVVGTPEERAARQRLQDVVPAAAAAAQPSLLDRLAGSRTVRNVALIGTTVAAIAIVAVVGFNMGAPSSNAGIGANSTPAPSAPVLDQAVVADLMAKIQANPNDADALMGLGDQYYKIRDFGTAADWFTKVTAAEPTVVRGFLALGAAKFNQGDYDGAETAWTKAAEIDDTNVEAHYDLGFLYLNRQPADMDGVKLHWNRVVELAPDSDVAKTVKAHLDAFAAMTPAPGGSAAPDGSAAPSATPDSSATPDASATPAATPAPTATPAP